MIDAKAFDPYEVIGVITPGAVVALMLATQWPELRALFGQEGLSIGDLGFFVVMAFVLGHLVQALGNLLETLVWSVTGMPSAWVRSPKQTLISTAQRDQLEAKVTALENTPVALASLGRRQWGCITARIAGKVRAAGRGARLDAFLRTYGLARGLAAGFIVAAVWLGVKDQGVSEGVVLAAGLAAVALYRMVRFARHYARSLFQEYLDAP